MSTEPDPAAATWTPDDLTRFADQPSLVLTVGGDAGGDRPHNGVEIGMVTAGGELYVRAYSGPRSRWYQAAATHGRGWIRIDGSTREVVLHTGTRGPDGPGGSEGQLGLVEQLGLVGPVEQIDQAFTAKYGAAAAGLVTSAAARAATIRITPA